MGKIEYPMQSINVSRVFQIVAPYPAARGKPVFVVFLTLTDAFGLPSTRIRVKRILYLFWLG